MSEFIVLGLIPGTQLQITFILWLLVVLVLGTGVMLWVARRAHLFRNWLITVCLLMLTRRPLRA